VLQKKWKKLMKPRPADLDVKALEDAFYAQPSHAGLRTLQTLHDEAQLLVWRTLKELRKFVSAKEDQVAAVPAVDIAVRCCVCWAPCVHLHVVSGLHLEAGTHRVRARVTNRRIVADTSLLYTVW
jgi:hypothetical protein